MQITPEQDAFNKVWDHFVVKKSQKSVNADGSCKYRLSLMANDPIRCAIGVLIPDEKYDSIFEKMHLKDVLEESAINLDVSFAREMQACHDTHYDRIEFTLRELAGRHQLVIP